MVTLMFQGGSSHLNAQSSENTSQPCLQAAYSRQFLISFPDDSNCVNWNNQHTIHPPFTSTFQILTNQFCLQLTDQSLVTWPHLEEKEIPDSE